MADQHLREVFHARPDAKAISLARKGVSDLGPLLPALARFEHLIELDLSNNLLRALPADLSEALPRVASLFMAGNPVLSPASVLPGLSSMPCLRNLHVDMGNEAHEEELVRGLPRLGFFNHINISDDDDALEPERVAVADGAVGDGEAAERADEDAKAGRTVGPSVAAQAEGAPESEPAAEPAPAPAPAQGAVDEAGPELPAIREIAMTEDDLESVALVFGALKALRADVDGVDQDALTLAFDAHVQAVMDRLRGRMAEEAEPFVRQAEILKAKHDLYDVVAAQVAEHAGTGPASRQFSAVVRRLRGEQQQLVAELPKVVADAAAHSAAHVSWLKDAKARADDRSAQLLDAAKFLEGELERAKEWAGTLEARAAGGRGGDGRQADAGLEARVRELEEENAELRAALQRAGVPEQAGRRAPAPRGIAAAGDSPGKLRASALAHGRTGMAAAGAGAPEAAAAPAPPPVGYAARHAAARAADASGGPGGSAAPSFETAKRAAAAGGDPSAADIGPDGSVMTVPTSSGVAIKELSLKQLKSVIESVYASKRRFDAKCAKAKLPRETLEQHMYTYLNQHYGLRKLIVQHAAAIVNAVNRYSPEDNDVCVFGQILRNEVEEKFVDTQSGLKSTVKDLLRVFLKAKNAHKTDSVVDRLLRQRTATVVFREEWTDMVRYMYKAEDADILCRIVEEVVASDPRASSRLRHFKAIQSGRDEVASEGAELVGEAGVARRTAAKQRKEAEIHREAVEKGAINYLALLKTMLDFQLRGHQKFLEKFRRVFAHVDGDSNGVVNEPEFRRLVRGLDSSKNDEDITALVGLVDPHGHGHITFSDCVEMLLGSA